MQMAFICNAKRRRYALNNMVLALEAVKGGMDKREAAQWFAGPRKL